MTEDNDLAGLGVMITRPASQCRGLYRLVETHGGRPLAFPAMTIEAIKDPKPAQKLLAESWDLVIYTSTNAVRFAVRLKVIASRDKPVPDTVALATIGASTAATLTTIGCPPDIVPERQDSEGLLALPEFSQLAGKRILIIRGEEGRKTLGDALIQRGAQVSIAEVYRRMMPNIKAEEIDTLLDRWEQDVEIIVATSGDIIRNLRMLIGETGYKKLFATPIIVISKRIQRIAIAFGFENVICAEAPNDAAIMTALLSTVNNKASPQD